jgi:hypothetical protein
MIGHRAGARRNLAHLRIIFKYCPFDRVQAARLFTD